MDFMTLREHTIKNVKKWIEELRKRYQNQYISLDGTKHISIPDIKCPNCDRDSVSPLTMHCSFCEFVIPEEFQPPTIEAMTMVWGEDQVKLRIAKTIEETKARLEKIDLWE